MPKQPQDRKPAKGEKFRFRGVNGKSYTLPHAEKGRKSLTGRDMRDALLGGEPGQMALMIKVLEAAKPSPAALDAFYSLPADEMTEQLGAWAEHEGQGDEPSLGESSPSSD